MRIGNAKTADRTSETTLVNTWFFLIMLMINAITFNSIKMTPIGAKISFKSTQLTAPGIPDTITTFPQRTARMRINTTLNIFPKLNDFFVLFMMTTQPPNDKNL